MEHVVTEGLINIWASILTLIAIVYVVLDGFDLGVGMLSLLEKDGRHRGTMMDCLNGVWDANETWLVLLGGTLFGAFPLAYATTLQALYVPILLMLFSLIFRGVAFEFRLYAATGSRNRWLTVFGIASLIAGLAQGLALGGLMRGTALGDTHGPVDVFAWFSPFALLTAAALCVAYALLGATYLAGKTEGRLRAAAYGWAHQLGPLYGLLYLVFLIGSSLQTPYLLDQWAVHPLRFGLAATAIALALALLRLALRRRADAVVFPLCASTVVLSALTLAASHYPYLIPQTMTLHMAASSTRTLEFMLYALGGLLPLMLGYNAYQYFVFRGRISGGH